jgi:hypothetical protein
MDPSAALDVLTGASSAPPAVRRPVFEVNFGAGSGKGAAGGLAGTAGSLAATATSAVAAGGAALGLGGGSTNAWKQFVISITVETGLAPFVDAAEIDLAAGPQAPTVSVGDAGSISMGYEDSSTELVFTGQVDVVRYGVNGRIRIKASNGGAILSGLRINQSYEQQGAGDITNDLVGRAGVETDTIEAGVSFPFFVLDDRRNCYVHIAALALKSGFIAYLTPEGKLNLAPFTAGQAVQTFTYGADLLWLEWTEGTPPVGTAITFGEGAAASQGQDAWSWLQKDASEVKGTSGSGAPERQIQDRSLRTSSAVQKAADGIASAAAQLKLTGRLLVPGAPAVAVGRAIEIAGAPQANLNGTYMVRGVRHQYSKENGFTTVVHFSRVGESAGAAAGLAGLLEGVL